MKTMKKTLSLVLAVVMALALAMPAMAAGDTASIQLTNEPEKFKDDHTYLVYQIFTGTIKQKTITEDGKETTVKELQNVKYGANYGSTGASVPKGELDAIGTDARAFAETLVGDGTSAHPSKLTGQPVATLTKDDFKAEGLATGYYLIVDSVTGQISNIGTPKAGDVFSQYIVQLLDNITLDTKKDVTEGDKIISSDDHPSTEGGDANPGISTDGKTDNVSIGDKVNFTITAKVPSHATDYDYYYFIINDTLSNGLTLDPTSITVKTSADADEDGKPDTLVASTDYELYVADKFEAEGADAYKTPSDGHSFEVALLNAKAHPGETITVTYTATLNKDAVIGGDGNLNTQNVTYSNNPNEDYDGSQDTSNPGKPKSDTTVPTGTTPDSTTTTYTSGIKLQKLDQDGMALKGASFTIEGDSINQVVTNSETFTVNGEGAYWKLKTGAYTTEAPVTADYMKEITGAKAGDDGYVLDDENGTLEVGGHKYRVVNADEAPAYILMEKNDQLYDSTTTKYAKSTTETVENTNETTHISQNLAVNEDGTLNLEGLGAGTYTIKETVVPEGYTKAADITVVITFNNTTKQFTATVNGTETAADATTNLFPVDVVNVAGNVLPSTGGIGTKIFYTMGAVLVIGAGVVLVSRKRAGE